MTSLPPPPPGTRAIEIPLGVMDVTALVHPTGDVHIVSQHPIPEALHEVVCRVLQTWMIDLPAGATEGSTMVGQQIWAECFGRRATEVADA